MRTDWVPISASALVVGAMSLVFGSLLNPSQGSETALQTLRIVESNDFRWMAMAVMYFFASIALTLGLPVLVTVLGRRGRGIGLTGIIVLSVGTIGTSGFAMLMVFFRAMVVKDAVKPGMLTSVAHDRGLAWFLFTWIGCFYGGLLLTAVALFLGGKTPRWVPVVLVIFVAMLTVSSHLGRVGSAVQVMLLAIAFTGIAMAAVTDGQASDLTREHAF